MDHSSHIHSTSNRYSPTRTNIFLTQVNHRGKPFISRPPTQMEKDIEYYIRGLNTLIKKMANIDDQLADYAREFDKKRTEFIGMEKQSEERIEKMEANTRILNGKVAAVCWSSLQIQHRINNCTRDIEETKVQIEASRLASKVLKLNISEAGKASDKNKDKQSRIASSINGLDFKRSSGS